jgi:hypothetical protein
MTEERPSPETARRNWYADQVFRAAVAIVLIGGSAWVGYTSAVAELAEDAAKWREVAAAYQAEPDVGIALLRNMAGGQ